MAHTCPLLYPRRKQGIREQAVFSDPDKAGGKKRAVRLIAWLP